MGDPKRIRKKYKTPRQPFERHRIDSDLALIGKYGLRNMKAVWKLNTLLANFRSNARRLLSLDVDDRKIGEQELIGRLQRLGLLDAKATLDNVLSLKIESFLERRLQTMVYKSGMATTPHHSRQMIVHGHIIIGDKIAKSPSYIVPAAEEKLIVFNKHSPLAKESHKALPSNVFKNKKPQADKKDSRRGDRRGGRPGDRGGQRRPQRTPGPSASKIVEKEKADVDVVKIAIDAPEAAIQKEAKKDTKKESKKEPQKDAKKEIKKDK